MLLIGHRGCYYPGYNKNTIRSFQKVTDEGVGAIEFDIQLCGDKHLVVVHNLDLEEVSTGKGLVSETSLADLKELFAGDPSRGEDRIPSLLETFEFFASCEKAKRPVAHAELKGDGTGVLTGKMIQEFIEAGKLDEDDILISSFNWQELKDIRTVLPHIRVALLDGAIHRKKLLAKMVAEGFDADACMELFGRAFSYGNEDYMLPHHDSLEENLPIFERECEDVKMREMLRGETADCLNGAYYNDELLDEAEAMNASSVNLWSSTVGEAFVKQAHARGFKVYVYTANTEEEWRHLGAIGVDGIFTDYFAKAREVFGI